MQLHRTKLMTFNAQRSLENVNQLQPIISLHQRNKFIMCQLILSHINGGVLIEIYSSLPVLAPVFTGQAYRRKISCFGDAEEASSTPFAIADTNVQYRQIQITASLEMHRLTPENRLPSRGRAIQWLNTLLLHKAQIQPQNLIG